MIWIIGAAILLFLLLTGLRLYRLNKISEQKRKEIDPSKLKDWDDEDDD